MPAVLEASGITVRFGGNVAVDDVSLTVSEGRILGLIGPNGAGKTTLFNALTGYVNPSSGTVGFDGRDVTRLPPFRRTRLGMGRTFQIDRPFEELTVFENALIPAFLNVRGRRDAERVAWNSLEAVGLADRALQRAADLNLARRRRLELAKALAVQPRMLFLDEMMAGLNPPALAEMIGFVRDLSNTGLAIVMVEHIMKAINELCGEVIVLASGRTIAQGTPGQVTSDPGVIAAYLGGVDEGDV
jgi:branched-chain amino acid transport system ATP-binding protein